MHGALILDKTEGITSHTAVMQVRRLTRERRIGHLGTLDPFATGVLVLLMGHATRLARFYADREKTYEGVMRFGFSTDTFDGTGTPASPDVHPQLTAAEVSGVFAEFVGPQMQRPPVFSAKKIGGVPAYRLARKGLAVTPESASVTVHSLELIALDGALASFRCGVSSGTYIRSLAHDIGNRLKCGAHLAQLRRSAVGEFAESQAVTFDQLEKMTGAEGPPIIPLESLLPELPAFTLSASERAAVSHGHPVQVPARARWLRLLNQGGGVTALAESLGNDLYQPRVVLETGG